MGHIKLVVPVVHIWYFKSLPNKIGYLLGTGSKKLESLVYYERYCVIQGGEADSMIRSALTMKESEDTHMALLTEDEYLDILDKLPKDNQLLSDEDPNKFIAKMGAEAVHMLLSRIDLDALSYQLRNAAAFETSQQRKAEALKRLSVVEAFREANSHIVNKPEWMVMQYIPVIPT
jgi:DNA-directed RNA polymerase subunit beta'